MSLTFGVAFASVAGASEASPCGVTVFAGEALSPSEYEELLRQLRAGLAASGLDVCATDTPAEERGVAFLRLSASDDGSTTLTLAINDRVTRKRVERTVDLRSLSAEARLFALSVAAEELLAATWAETLLEREKSTPPPPPVVEKLLLAKKKPIESRTRLGIGFRTDAPRLDELRGGLELSLSQSMTEGLFVQGTLAWLEALPKTDPLGTLGATQWSMSGAVGAFVARSSTFEFAGATGVRVGYERLGWSTTSDEWVAASRSAWIVALEVTLGASLRLGERQRVEAVVHGGPILVGARGLTPTSEAVGSADATVGLTLRGVFSP